MNYCRTEYYKGYEISGQALKECEFWRGILTLDKRAHRPESVATSPLCATAEEAMNQAFKAGEKCVDSENFELSAEVNFCPLPPVQSHPIKPISMQSDLTMKFHKGEEFTRRDDRHVHCVVLDLVPETLSYSVAYTETGNILRLSERLLMEHYIKSTEADKREAMENLGSAIQLDGMAE